MGIEYKWIEFFWKIDKKKSESIKWRIIRIKIINNSRIRRLEAWKNGNKHFIKWINEKLIIFIMFR